jgi:hypothetical protein
MPGLYSSTRRKRAAGPLFVLGGRRRGGEGTTTAGVHGSRLSGGWLTF